jgi:CheY-like chemotaxis protein
VDFRSQATVPVRWHDRVIGTMGVRSRTPSAYSEEDVKFLEIYAGFVAQALNTANLIRLEHAFTHEQLAEQLAQEINEPINSVLNEVYLLLQEYIGHDSNTLKRLRTIEGDVDKVRQAIRKVIESERPRLVGVAKGGRDQVLKGKHILVADDDEAIRQSMHDILTREGCVVELAGDGEAAMELLKREASFDLVLSDIKMPKLDGYALYAGIRQMYPEMPVILMTAFGYDPDHSIVRARKQGLEVVLFKPFKVTVLRKEIHKALVAGQTAKAKKQESAEGPRTGDPDKQS